MSSKQPFLYHANFRDDRLPRSSFDPKAITRASWEPAPARRQQYGPLVSLDYDLEVDNYYATRQPGHIPPGVASNWRIKAVRRAQLVLRVLLLNGALCLIAFSALIISLETVATWLLLATPAVVALHSAYSIYHLTRDVDARPPALSSAYQVFSAALDLATVGAYVVGVISTRSTGPQWHIRIESEELQLRIVPAMLWTLIAAASLHCLSCATCCWLGRQFRKIASMPPDMNPLSQILKSGTGRRSQIRGVGGIAQRKSKASIANESIMSNDDDFPSPYTTSSRQAQSRIEADDSSAVPPWRQLANLPHDDAARGANADAADTALLESPHRAHEVKSLRSAALLAPARPKYHTYEKVLSGHGKQEPFTQDPHTLQLGPQQAPHHRQQFIPKEVSEPIPTQERYGPAGNSSSGSPDPLSPSRMRRHLANLSTAGHRVRTTPRKSNYGELTSASTSTYANRNVSSGNDYELQRLMHHQPHHRHVSGQEG